MKPKIFLIIFLLLLLLSNAVSGLQADAPDSAYMGVSIDRETIVQLSDAPAFTKAVESGEFLGAPVINSYEPLQMLRLQYPFRQAASGEFSRECQSTGAEISPNFPRHAHVVPDDPKIAFQSNLDIIDAKDGWELFTGNSSVTVAVIDTGIAIGHPDLQGNIIGGANLRPGEEVSDLSDPHGHGTAVAGIIAATTDNGVGIAGLCWKVRLLPLKVLGGDELTTTLFEEAAAIDYAVSAGARVINMSFGGPGTSSVEQTAIKNAAAKGVILVASAGNDSAYGDYDTAPSGLNFPAAFREVIAVGAITNNLEKTDFSNYGQDQCEVVAPGLSIYTTLPGNLGDLIGPIIKGRDYGWATGTSFSAPQVTALAALLMMKEPGLSALEVRQRIDENAKNLGGPDNDGDGVDDYLGYGIVQYRDALADSPIGRNDALKAGVFASPIYPENVYVYVELLKSIDNGSLAATALPDFAPPVQIPMVKIDTDRFIGLLTWPVVYGPVEISIRASHGGVEYPAMIITHKP